MDYKLLLYYTRLLLFALFDLVSAFHLMLSDISFGFNISDRHESNEIVESGLINVTPSAFDAIFAKFNGNTRTNDSKMLW